MSAKQIAAMPVRWTKDGKLSVLLITSRDTGRWVMPKGWPMPGKKSWEAAEIEAMDEAGVTGRIGKKPIGSYLYDKRLDDGEVVPVRVSLFPLLVSSVKKSWLEKAERKRKWFSVKGAAKAVNEPELQEILKQVSKDSNFDRYMSKD